MSLGMGPDWAGDCHGRDYQAEREARASYSGVPHVLCIEVVTSGGDPDALIEEARDMLANEMTGREECSDQGGLSGSTGRWEFCDVWIDQGGDE